MADAKISALTALAQADLDSVNDVLPIVDTGAAATKKITPRLLVGGTVNNLIQTWTVTATAYSAIKVNVTDTASAAASKLLDLQVGASPVFSVGKSGLVSIKGLVDAAQTWTVTATAYTAIKADITDTASAAASLLLDLQVGTTSQFKVSKGGAVTAVGALACAALNPTGDLTLADTKNIVVNATTGTKIGTATTQKLAFFNSSPIVQPVNTVAIDTALVNLGLRATGGVANFATVVTSPGTYGGIYVYDGTTAQTVSTGSTPTTLTCFNTANGVDGLANDMTVAKASNKITVTRAGTYKVAYSISYSSSVTGSIWEFYVFNGATQLNGTGAQSKTANASDIQCISGNGFMAVTANTDITLRGYHGEGGNANITITHGNMTLHYIGA